MTQGETLGIVGESGSGKSMSMLSVVSLLPDTARVSGSVQLAGRELLGLGPRELRKIRGSQVGMIFQDPMTSLNPVFTVGDQVGEAIRTHEPGMSRRKASGPRPSSCSPTCRSRGPPSGPGPTRSSCPAACGSG